MSSNPASERLCYQFLQDFFANSTSPSARNSVVMQTVEACNVEPSIVSDVIDQLIASQKLVSRPDGLALVYIEDRWEYALTSKLSELEIFNLSLRDGISHLPENQQDILVWSTQEMINNAIDHSDGAVLTIWLRASFAETQVWISDTGIGIFRKLQGHFDLDDERHAILELCKGKVTTDHENHSGEGIFFTSRLVDVFTIRSGSYAFISIAGDDWMTKVNQQSNIRGTTVVLELRGTCERKIDDVLTKHTCDGDFTMTKVPVKLADFVDGFASRAGARRLIRNLEKFHTVILDFSDVSFVSRSFVDEIFRVFANRYPGVRLIPLNSNEKIQAMIGAAIRKSRKGQS